MRLIDAEKLMLTLNDNYLANSPIGNETLAVQDYMESVCEGLEMAMKTLEEAPTVGGWISVKDRMPDDGIFVLVCNDDGHMMVAKYESEVIRWEYKYINYDWDVWDDEEQGPVCWWMPLPEPPKERDENDATDRR